jgi:hypothetical protein
MNGIMQFAQDYPSSERFARQAMKLAARAGDTSLKRNTMTRRAYALMSAQIDDVSQAEHVALQGLDERPTRAGSPEAATASPSLGRSCTSLPGSQLLAASLSRTPSLAAVIRQPSRHTGRCAHPHAPVIRPARPP